MNNYPDGMTASDWEHVEGREHWPECPAHEDRDDRDEDECECECAEITRSIRHQRWDR